MPKINDAIKRREAMYDYICEHPLVAPHALSYKFSVSFGCTYNDLRFIALMHPKLRKYRGHDGLTYYASDEKKGKEDNK